MMMDIKMFLTPDHKKKTFGFGQKDILSDIAVRNITKDENELLI